MTSEEKALEKIRKVLIADPTIIQYCSTRVYASHISSIVEPKYPAISLFMMSSRVLHPLDEIVNVRIQIDAWFPSSEYNTTDIFNCLERVRALLHKQNLTDTLIGLVSYQSLQSESGPLMHEDETELFHLPSVFELVVK